MQRIFISEEDFKNRIITDSEILNHLSNVLRMKESDEIEIMALSTLVIAKLTKFDKKQITFEVTKELEIEEKEYQITLLQGLAKLDKIDEIIKHSVELNVDHIILSQMDFSIMKIKNDAYDAKKERYNKIALNASSQAHRNNLTDVDIMPLNKIDYKQYDLLLMLDTVEARKDNPQYLEKEMLENKKNIIFVVGPEGGISPKERELFINQGFLPIALSKNILRTETASLALLAQLDLLKK